MCILFLFFLIFKPGYFLCSGLVGGGVRDIFLKYNIVLVAFAHEGRALSGDLRLGLKVLCFLALCLGDQAVQETYCEKAMRNIKEGFRARGAAPSFHVWRRFSDKV